jgi:hypothetical protein
MAVSEQQVAFGNAISLNTLHLNSLRIERLTNQKFERVVPV